MRQATAIAKLLRMHPSSYYPREGMQKHSMLIVKMPNTRDKWRIYVKPLITCMRQPHDRGNVWKAYSDRAILAKQGAVSQRR